MMFLAAPHTKNNKNLKEGKIPQSWNRAEVTLILKKGDKKNPGNYRSVSLTSIVYKTFEGFIRDCSPTTCMDSPQEGRA